MVGAIDVPVDLRAEEAACEGVLGIARDANGPAVLDGDQHRASVRAVVGTRAANGGGGSGRRIRRHAIDHAGTLTGDGNSMRKLS